MNVETQHEWFDATANEIVKDLPGTAYTIIALKNSGYRVLIEHGKIKRGFNAPFKTSMKEFTKLFSGAINDIKRIKSQGLNSPNSL